MADRSEIQRARARGLRITGDVSDRDLAPPPEPAAGPDQEPGPERAVSIETAAYQAPRSGPLNRPPTGCGWQ